MQWHTINFKPVYREIESKWNRKVNTPQFLANSWNPEPNVYYDMRQNEDQGPHMRWCRWIVFSTALVLYNFIVGEI